MMAAVPDLSDLGPEALGPVWPLGPDPMGPLGPPGVTIGSPERLDASINLRLGRLQKENSVKKMSRRVSSQKYKAENACVFMFMFGHTDVVLPA